MWGTSYRIEINFSKLMWMQLLWFVLLFLFAVAVVVAVFLIRKKRTEKVKRLKNLQKVEECFEEVSNRILNLEDRAKFFKLLDDGETLEGKFEEVTLNYKNLKEYYEGIKKSYSDSEFKTFLTIYNILKSDLDYLEKTLKNSEQELQKHLKYIESVQKAVEEIKNKEVLKQKIDKLFQKRFSEDDLKKEIEGIRKIDEKIEYFKNLDDNKKNGYITTLLQLLTNRFEEKYPLILSKMPDKALELQREFDNLLLKLQVSDNIEKIVLAEEFFEKLLKIENQIACDFQQKEKDKREFVERFEKIVSDYDRLGFKFYKIDLEIEKVKNLIENCTDDEKLKKEVSDLERKVLDFVREFSECRRLLEKFEGFLKEASKRVKAGSSFGLFDSYYKNLKELLYECNFDEFKRRYIEYQNAISDEILRWSSFSSGSGDAIKKVIKDLFDEFFG